MPATTARGVARPSAQGQAETRTDTAHVIARRKRGSGPQRIQSTAVRIERPMTTGTNQAAILST